MMFRRKRATPRRANEVECAIAEMMRAWRDIGDTFEYLGRTCVVTGHKDVLFYPFGVVVTPRLRADYADENGVIHAISFSPREFATLQKMQPNV